MDSLLGEKNELETQTIYFASADELNDPVEGVGDIVWSGDKIVWTNLFKHFAISLHEFMLGLREGVLDFNTDSIPIWHPQATPQVQNWREEIWNRFSDESRIHTIIDAIANSNHKIRYLELRIYLRCLFGILLEEIQNSHAARGIISESIERTEDASATKIIEGLLSLISRIKDDESEIDDILLSIEINRSFEGITGCNSSSISTVSDRQFPKFPAMYVEQLERFLWPKWYTACFTTSYHNSSLWGHYADGHKGACLIFDKAGTGLSDFEKRFHKVNYVGRLPQVDFFRSIGTESLDLVMSHWYTDEHGNVSECATHIGNQVDENAWRQTLWEKCLRHITVKTRDWEYENEYRLIANDVSLGDDENDRTLKYNFNLLKGIIFGIRTSNADKRTIVEIVKRKCAEHNRTYFQLLQARYSHRDGDIRAEKIQF